MKTIQTKGWYDIIELSRAANEIKNTIAEARERLYPADTRYVHIVVDQTTGNFAVRDHRGRDIEAAVLYALFPTLRADYPIPEVEVKETPVAG